MSFAERMSFAEIMIANVGDAAGYDVIQL